MFRLCCSSVLLTYLSIGVFRVVSCFLIITVSRMHYVHDIYTELKGCMIIVKVVEDFYFCNCLQLSRKYPVHF